MELSFWQPLLNWLETNPLWLVFSVFIISFLESLAIAGLLVPGVLLLLAITAVAGNADISFWPLLVAGFWGAVLGDGLSFFLGRKFHQRIRGIRPFRTHPEWIQTGEMFFRKHGGKSVVIGRFVGPVRPIIPLIAGMLDMSSLRFFLVNALSAIAWAPTYILPGYFVGTSVRHRYLPPEVLHALVIIIVIAVLLFYLLKKLHFQLQPGQYLYQKISSIIRRNHSLSYWWHWFSRHQHNHLEPVFPLNRLMIVLGLVCSFILTVAFIINGYFFADADQVFQAWISTNASNSKWIIVDNIMTVLYLMSDAVALMISFAVLSIWLLIKKHKVAFLHLLFSGVSVLLLAKSFQFIDIWLSENSTRVIRVCPDLHASVITAVFGFISLLIAHELVAKFRWIIYVFMSCLVFILAVPDIYFDGRSIANVTAGILLGGIICNVIGLHFYRYKTHELHLDIKAVWLGLLWLFCLISYVVLFFSQTLASFDHLA